MGSHKGCQGKSKVIVPKCYKHLAYALAHKMNLFVLFWIKKDAFFKAKFDSFNVFMFSHFFVWMLQSTLKFIFNKINLKSKILRKLQYCPYCPICIKRKRFQKYLLYVLEIHNHAVNHGFIQVSHIFPAGCKTVKMKMTADKAQDLF